MWTARPSSPFTGTFSQLFAVPSLWSLLVGVGNIFAITWRLVTVLRGPPFMRRFIAMCAAGVLLSSFATGVGQSPARAIPWSVGISLILSPLLLVPPPLLTSVGVGKNPETVPSMPGTHTRSRKSNRPRLVTAGFQVIKHLVECHCDEARNIFTKDESRSELVNNPQHFRPEVTVICRAFSLPGNGKRLTWESSANKVNWPEVCCSALSRVPELWDVGPVFCEDSLTVFIYLHLPCTFHPCSF